MDIFVIIKRLSYTTNILQCPSDAFQQQGPHISQNPSISMSATLHLISAIPSESRLRCRGYPPIPTRLYPHTTLTLKVTPLPNFCSVTYEYGKYVTGVAPLATGSLRAPGNGEAKPPEVRLFRILLGACTVSLRYTTRQDKR